MNRLSFIKTAALSLLASAVPVFGKEKKLELSEVVELASKEKLKILWLSSQNVSPKAIRKATTFNPNVDTGGDQLKINMDFSRKGNSIYSLFFKNESAIIISRDFGSSYHVCGQKGFDIVVLDRIDKSRLDEIGQNTNCKVFIYS